MLRRGAGPAAAPRAGRWPWQTRRARPASLRAEHEKGRTTKLLVFMWAGGGGGGRGGNGGGRERGGEGGGGGREGGGDNKPQIRPY